MCFAVIVGKNASADGAVLFGHNEQNFGLNIINYRKIPRMAYTPGETIQLDGGGRIPAPAESAAYLWVESPGLEFSDNYFNEWGVAIAGDGCPTREDSVEVVAVRGDIIDGGIGYLLPRLIAMQAHSARDAVKLAGELIGRFGYTGTGRSLILADPQEAWVMSIARGRSWIAQRVPDDQVVVVPNIHVIGEGAGLNDHGNVMASPGLVDYAVKRGWYDPAVDRPFSFRAAFNAEPNPGIMQDQHGCCCRQWHGQGLITGQHLPLSPSGELPFAVTPKKKISVLDVAAVLRSHLEDTEYDNAPQNVAGSPHHSEEELDYSFARGLCNIATQESVVFQLRSWLPREIGCVAWRANSVPCTSVYTPWYLGISATPDEFYRPCSLEQQLDLEHHYHPDVNILNHDESFAFWPFYDLGLLVDQSYAIRFPQVRGAWEAYETEEFSQQAEIEAQALALYQHDQVAATDFLTRYTTDRARQAGALARQLVARLQRGDSV